MRLISKRSEPHALLNWKRANRNTPDNLRYGGGGFPTVEVRQALLEEQGYLCGYTMKAIRTTSDCHIEHIFPRSRSTNGEDIAYDNMLACFPPSNQSVECEYGAKRKDDYDSRSQPFVSPLERRVDQAFSFNDDGKVVGNTSDATTTIEVLNLNCATLKNDRAAAIGGALLGRKGRRLTASEARRIAGSATQPDANGHLAPFCIAVAQAATRYADREERRATRLRGTARV